MQKENSTYPSLERLADFFGNQVRQDDFTYTFLAIRQQRRVEFSFDVVAESAQIILFDHEKELFCISQEGLCSVWIDNNILYCDFDLGKYKAKAELRLNPCLLVTYSGLKIG
ncbi:hypothetical protein [Cerasicoccus frondis]|uniref:hypothetical protein n=1 Tax=Cerasicoccus frondis TaxID=490090 RepID=UPI0028525F1B|nr:hypothetical protein [Cerasicoccus frondis]